MDEHSHCPDCGQVYLRCADCNGLYCACSDCYCDEVGVDYEDRAFQKEIELVSECKCGAWQNVNGKVLHVADCCCGAE